MGEPGTKEILLSLEELEAAVGLRTGRKHVLSILVENKPGVLTRIAGLFARRGFNIDTLAVGPTDDEKFSRITLTLDGAVHPIDQVTKQLHKLVNVLKIRDLEPAGTVARELALFKVTADGAGARRGHAVLRDLPRPSRRRRPSARSIVEVTGDAARRSTRSSGSCAPFGLVEMMRTGEIAISRGRSGDVGRARGSSSAATSPPARLVGRPRRARAPRGSAPCSPRGWRARLRRARATGARDAGQRQRRLAGGVDPSAVVLASRRAGEPWMCFEQPERERSALAALGACAGARGRGAAALRRRSRRAGASSSARAWPTRRGPARPGLVACGGFAFAPDGGGAPAAGRGSRRRRWWCPRSSLARRRAGGLVHRQRRGRRRRHADGAGSSGSSGGWPSSRAPAAAAARPGIRPSATTSRRPDAAGALRGGGRARGRADPGRRAREDRARARGRRARAGGRTTPPRSSACCARRSPAASSTPSGAARRPSSAPARSCCCAATGCARAPSRWPARSAAAPTPRSTTTSASGCCAARRTARSTRSSRGGSSATLRPHAVWVTMPRRAGGRASRQHPAPGDADPRAAGARRSARSSSPALLHPTPAVGGEPAGVALAADPARSRGSIAAGTPGPSAGPTPTRTASSASRCAARCSRGGGALLRRRAGSSPTPIRRPSWPRPRSSSRRCCRCWRDSCRRGSATDRGAMPPAAALELA